MNTQETTPELTIPKHLQLLIKPVSGRCNIRCKYCFYRPVHEELFPNSSVMSDEILESMIKQLLEMRQPMTTFSWQGGEPTLAGLEFFERAIELMQKHGDGAQYVSNAFQTNAILIDDKWASFFKKYNFLVGISIDGPKDLHEANRGPNFDKVLRGAQTAMRQGVETNALACVSRASLGRGKEAYNYLHHELGFPHLQFIPVVEFDGSPNNIMDFSCPPEVYGDFLIEVFDTWRNDPNPACIRMFDALISKAATGHTPYCIHDANCADYVVVEEDGSIYVCDFFVRPEWQLGNVLDGKLATSRQEPLAHEFMKLKPNKPTACSKCQWWGVCRGGCLKEREANGGFDRPSYFCAGLKKFFDYAWPYMHALGRDHSRAGNQPEVDLAIPAKKRRPRANEPCSCGSGRKYKRCCGR